MNIDALRETLAQSQAGIIAFPDVVRVLAAEGVESYHVDLVRHEDTFYAHSGATHVEKMDFPPTHISEELSAPDVVSAIRDAQAGRIRYPEFLDRIMTAGIKDYVAYLSGQKVIYFGRKGDFHVEDFPKPKA